MIEKMKSINRALLELGLGILFLGLVSQVVLLFAFEDILRNTIALWFGVCMAIVTAIHMYIMYKKSCEAFDLATFRF